MKNFLILYDSVNGQTQKIANRIAEKLKFEGHWVTLRTPRSFSDSIEDFDAIIVGGPVRVQKYPRDLRKWVSKHAKELQLKKTAFFSVCLGILQKENPAVQNAEKKIAEDFLAINRWRPNLIDIFGGALTYTQYGWLTKIIMRYISKQAGGSTDTSRDHEYTDWNQVDRFALGFLQQVNKDTIANDYPNTLIRDLNLEN